MTVQAVEGARTKSGWKRPRGNPSLAEVFGSIRTRPTGSFWRKLAAFLGPGYLVAVGYMDPGNWATSLAGGSKFGYALLIIALMSNIMAICCRLYARGSDGAGATSRKPAATPIRAGPRGRCGWSARSRSAPPISPK